MGFFFLVQFRVDHPSSLSSISIAMQGVKAGGGWMSQTPGTGRNWVWLLRSRPDQVIQPTMRGGPSNSILAC